MNSPRRGMRQRRLAAAATNPLVALGATYWLQFTDITDTGAQTITPKIGTGDSTVGSTSGVDTNDPTIVASSYLNFDGTDDHVALPAGATPTVTISGTAFTVLVVWSSTTSGTKWMYSSDAVNDRGVNLLISASGLFGIVANSGLVANLASPGAGAWFDGTKRAIGLIVDNGTVRTYERVAGRTATAAVGATMSHATPRLGSRRSDGSGPFAGRMYHSAQFDGVALSLANLDTAADYLLSL
jgi:hypothetical protein